MKLNAKQLAELIAAALAPVFATILGEGKPSKTTTDDDNDDSGDEAPAKKPRGRPAGSTKKDESKTAGKGSKKPPADEDDGDEDDDGLGDDDGDDDGLGLDEEEEEVTQEDVVNAFKALKASHGIEKCREVLAKIGESNALNIPAKKYGEAMKEIQRAASKKK